MLAQPVLALTSLAYVAAGVRALTATRPARSPLAVGAAAALAAVGLGSFAFHGPQPAWAGIVHDVPIYALAVLLAAGLVVRRPPLRSLAGPAACFAVALAAYPLGRTGSSLCGEGPRGPLPFWRS